MPRLRLGALLFFLASTAQAQTISDPSFVADTIHNGNGMISVDFGPNNRLYVAEKQGRILTFASDGAGGYLAPTELADLRAAVDPSQESGLLGLVLDPDFANNRHMFLFYTTATDQRLVRIEINAAFDQMVAGSETILLSGLPRQVTFHKAGDLQFRPNEPDNIYVGIGDDSRALLAQDTSEYHGKILRVSKTNGEGLLTNPYQNGNPASVESRIWAIGLRNPFRFVFHPNVPNPDVIYLSENGNSTDRISWVLRGSDGSWTQGGDNAGFLSPPDGNHRVMATDSPFIVGIAIASGGPFSDPANPNSDTIFVSNGIARNIRRWRLTGADLDTLTPIAADNGNAFVTGAAAVDLTFGPDGSLYMTTTNNGESLGNQYVLQRIRFINGTAPIASFTTTPNPPRGNVPLAVTFTDASSDPDGTINAWFWQFGDGMTSTQQNPTYTYQTPGTYQASLRVTDDAGLQNTTQRTITAERTTSLTFTGQLFDGRDLQGNNLPIATQLRLYRGDGTTPIAFAGGVGPQGNGIAIGAGGAINAMIAVQLTAPEVVVSAGEGSGGLRAAFHGFVVPMMAAAHTETINLHVSTAAIRGRIRDTRGAPASVDLGMSRGGEGMLYAFPGGRDYLSGSGIPSTSVNHRTTSDALGFYYVPVTTAAAGARFYADVVADTAATVYLPATFAVDVAAGAVEIEDVTVGLQEGGASCDDLAMVPIVEAIDYTTQIQPIWNASCTGCHNAGSGNNGGLNLETNSYANLTAGMSLEVPGRRLVEPTDPSRSFLYEKINCSSPQVGTRMRPADPMRVEEQALIRDWIAQGALEMPGPPPIRDAGIPAEAGPGPIDQDGGMVAERDAGPDGGSSGPSQRPGKTELRGACGCREIPSGRDGRDAREWDFAISFAFLVILLLRVTRSRGARTRMHHDEAQRSALLCRHRSLRK